MITFLNVIIHIVMKERTKYQALLHLCISMLVLAGFTLYDALTGKYLAAGILAAIVAIEAVAVIIIYFQKTEKNH